MFRRKPPEPEQPQGPTGRYDGPVCWVDRNGEAPDGTPLVQGWHYSVRKVVHKLRVYDEQERLLHETEVEHEFPEHRLHLNDLAEPGEAGAFQTASNSWHHADPERVFYEYAQAGHRSWLEKHGMGNVVRFGGPGEDAQ